MAVRSVGAAAPLLSTPSVAASGPGRALLNGVPTSRTRRNHGTFMLGGQLAGVYSARGQGKCYGVSFELGAGTLSLAARMTAGQARAMAEALLAAATASETVQQRAGGAQ